MKTKHKVDKWARLRERLHDPEWRRYGYLMLGGKALGIAFLLVSVFMISSMIGTGVHADEAAAAPVLTGNDIVNPINTVWTLVAAFLVFGMQAGFTMLEAGRLQVALFILTLATGAAWYSLWEHYVQTRPRIMQSAVGRVIPLHSHGLVVYLTKDEQDWLTLIYFTGSVLALSVVVIHIFKTPFKR